MNSQNCDVVQTTLIHSVKEGQNSRKYNLEKFFDNFEKTN